MRDEDKKAGIFYVVTLLIGGVCFLPWVLSSYGIIPDNPVLLSIMMTLGGLSPTIAAILVVRQYYGERSKFLFSAFSRKCAPVWLVLSLMIPLLLFVGTLGIVIAFGAVYDLTLINWVTIIPLLISSVLMNVWEEIGWRGFALPELQGRHNALISSIIVGLMWAGWHWPHFLVKDSQMLKVFGSVSVFVIETVFVTIIMTWLYNSARGNLVVPTLYHAMENAAGIAIVIETGFVFNEIFHMVVITILAILVIVIFGIKNLSSKQRTAIVDLIEDN
ncbi:MAG: CPBP family intramembrane metalloprotease [Candidatus Thorarchaeota archaeon]|nr:CPBP family intramembrane metalloprotease [Candidatus Thorarchaeota archaeon]